MRFLKMMLVTVATGLLLACGGPPSDGDIRALMIDHLKSDSKQLAMLGIDLGEILEVGKVKVLNSAEDGKKVYVVEVESTFKFRKSVSEIKGLDRQMILEMTFGNFKAGQETEPSKSKFRVARGDKGWMLAEK